MPSNNVKVGGWDGRTLSEAVQPPAARLPIAKDMLGTNVSLSV